MQTKEYRTVDKSNWQRGPWDHEPDKAQWQDPATGLPCLIVRGPQGALCGYVGVSEGHPWHGKGYSTAIGQCTQHCDAEYDYHDHRIDSVIRVHGGLTFADGCRPSADESRGICHKPDAGEPDHVWWFGFDCAHLYDACPGTDSRYGGSWNDIYRDMDYVRFEMTSLAKQLAAVK